VATLIAPSGTVVHVDETFAGRLLEQGFREQEKPKASRAPSSKSK
jgi:hypothetical protein